MNKEVREILLMIEFVQIDQDVDFESALRVIELAFKLKEEI